MEAMDCIWVDRRTVAGRARARELIDYYQQNDKMPPLLIFPQGTTTNTRSLSMFKSGAFTTGRPTQPVALMFGNCFADMMITTEGFSMLHAGCQFINFVSVEFLEPHEPTQVYTYTVSCFYTYVRN